MTEKMLFFIPDISGFTNFVKHVEVDHSRHIISEILEMIIDANELGMEVAEVEGDAVFFYKKGGLPSSDKVIEQVKKMYVKFHEHLKLYETRRICQCGACSSAVDLTLKFVLHEGEGNMIKVKNELKPYGEDVIKIHRLLKNSVESNEYLLFTTDLLKSIKKGIVEQEWLKSEKGGDIYGELGQIDYESIDLGFLKKQVTLPPIASKGTFQSKPIKFTEKINCSAEKLYELVSNLDERHKWNKAVDRFEYKKGEVNRVGTKHICVIGNREVEIETVSNSFERGKLVYGERTKEIPVFKESTSYFIIEGNKEGAILSIEFHYVLRPFIGWLLRPFFMKKLNTNIKESVGSLRQLAEK